MKIKVLWLLILAGLCFSSSNAQTNDLFNRFRLAQSYEQAGELNKAKIIYEDVYKQQPDNFQFFDALNKIYITLKDYDASIRIISQRIELSPQDINLYGMLGGTYYQKGEEEKGYEIWDNALKNLPERPLNYRVIANYAVEKRAFSKAIDILQKGKKSAGEGNNYSYEIANLYSVLMNFKGAAEEYCEILKKDGNQISVVQSRMAQYLTKPDALQAVIGIVETYAEKEENLNFYKLLAWLYMEGNQYSKAYNVYLKIDEISKNAGSEIFTFAQKAFQDKHFEEAATAFKKILETYPSSAFTPNAKIGYTKTLEAALDQKYDLNSRQWKPFSTPQIFERKEYLEAIASYEDLAQNYSGNEAANEAFFRIGLIKLERLYDLPGATEAFTKIISYSQMSVFAVPSYLKLAEIALINGELNQAESYYDKVDSNPRAGANEKNLSNFMKAKIEFFSGQFELSSHILNTVEKNLTDNFTNEAIELSLLINTTKNDSLSLSAFAKAEQMAVMKKFTQAADIYQQLAQKENLLTINDLSALRYAEMKIAEDKLPEAAELLNSISQQKEKNIYADKATFLLGQLYQFGIKDARKATETYQILLANFPNSLYLDDARKNINQLNNNSSNNL